MKKRYTKHKIFKVNKFNSCKNYSFKMLILSLYFPPVDYQQQILDIASSTDLTLKSSVVGNFIRLSAIFISPWLQGLGGIKKCLFSPSMLPFASMWSASWLWVIDLKKTSVDSPLLFSGWQNCYHVTCQAHLPPNRISINHFCWGNSCLFETS